jgi:hypothetical protein
MGQRLLWAMLAAACALSTVATAADVIIDRGSQERYGNTNVHVCPVGFAMAGAQVNRNVFKCVRVVPPGRGVQTLLDTGTNRNFGRGNMHVCPAGSYMRGLHDGKNWLVCSNGVALEPTFLDAHGRTQTPDGGGMHQCPVGGDGRPSIMVGIHNGRNDFACAYFR